MSQRARIALKVIDLAASISFYVEALGFTLAESQSAPDRALLLDNERDPLLLVSVESK